MFNAAEGFPYKRFLRRLHSSVTVDWYLEIGCRSGGSLAAVSGKAIAVDPFFKISSNIVGDKPAMLFFQQTSDDFFASDILSAMKAKVSLSFIDGMHLFEYALRDFINVEKNAAPGGVAIFHDCFPYGHEMTTRDIDNLPKGAWTGDVWKLIPILKAYRPDLTIRALDAATTGLLVVSGLNPRSRKLSAAYEDIVGEWTPVTLENYGVERFNDLFEYESARGVMLGGFDIVPQELRTEKAATPEFVTP